MKEARIDLAKVAQQSRKSENLVSNLTAEQASHMTTLSQIKRAHQADLNAKDDEFRAERNRLQLGWKQFCILELTDWLEFESMMGEMEVLKAEWEKRAKTAEANLLKLIRKCDEKDRSAQAEQTRASNASKMENELELKRLEQIERQQAQLVAQNAIFLGQWSLAERLKKFMRDTTFELNKRWKSGLLAR